MPEDAVVGVMSGAVQARKSIAGYKTMLVIVLLQIIIGIGLAEILGHLFRGNPYYFWNYRFLYTTPDAFRNVEDVSNYVPNTDIVETGVFRDPFGRFFKEFECRYRSDDLGFVNNPRSNQRDYDVLVVGDSFTFGQAGCSWANELRRAVPGQSVYFAGMEATGPDAWDASLRYLERHGYRFKHVLVIFIADDFFRHRGQVRPAQLRCLHDIAACHGE